MELAVRPYDELGEYAVERGTYEFAARAEVLRDLHVIAVEPEGTIACRPRLPDSLKRNAESNIRGFAISRVPDGQERIDVHLGLTVGPWEVIESWTYRTKDATTGDWREPVSWDRPKIKSNVPGLLLSPPQERYVGTPGREPRTFVGRRSLVVELTDTNQGGVSRLAALDRAGKVHEAETVSTEGAIGVRKRRFHFQRLSLADLVELRFERANAMRVVFQNVSLKPGRRTHARAWVHSPPGPVFGAGVLSSPVPAAASGGEAKREDEVALSDLRYDGRSFEEWRRELRTELKYERRVEALNAFAVFGRNGYPRPAAEAIAEVANGRDFLEEIPKTADFNKAVVSAFRRLDIGATLPVVVRALREGNSSQRMFACLLFVDGYEVRDRLYGSQGEDAFADVIQFPSGWNELQPAQRNDLVAALGEASLDGDWRVRKMALFPMVGIAPLDAKVRQRIRDAFRDESPKVVLAALAVPVRFESPDNAARMLPACIELTQHGDEAVRSQAVSRLGQLAGGQLSESPESVSTVVTRLAGLLREDEISRSQVFQAICRAVVDIGPPAKDTVPILTDILKRSKNKTVLIGAATALEYIGPAAKEAESVLEDLAGDLAKDLDELETRADLVPYHAARALKAIRDPAWFQELRKAREAGLDPGEEVLNQNRFLERDVVPGGKRSTKLMVTR